MTSKNETIGDSQLRALDDTDYYATAWADVLEKANDFGVQWGGRGQGGRGRARRTFQPKDVVVDDVRLEFVGSHSASCRMLLEGATLKLLSGSIYALVGYNGNGKSTLLRRIDAGRVPGFPPHISTLYIPQDIFDSVDKDTTPLTILLRHHERHSQTSKGSVEYEIQQLEEELDDLDVEREDDQRRIEEIGEEISQLEDSQLPVNAHDLNKDIENALSFVGLKESLFQSPMRSLSPGLRKKVSMAMALICRFDLLLWDEPTDSLDIAGLIQLRRILSIICSSRNTTVLLVSHDQDLINDTATDVIYLSQQQLAYYPGNYNDFLFYRQQGDLHQLRQVVALEKKHGAMIKTLDNLKKQAIPKRGGTKKTDRQIESHKKKIERVGLNVDGKGHKWKQQKAGTGIKPGSINAVDASARRGLTTQQLLQMAQKSVQPPPDKAVQFVFRNVSSQWGEPL
jgi:ATPase subunit of ABC transporter with duplicated ATPase domains